MAESMRTSDALRMVANEARQGEWERAVCLDGAKYMERMERELSAYRTAEEQGVLVRLLPIDKRVFIVEDGEIFEFRVYQYSLLSVNNKNVRYCKLS